MTTDKLGISVQADLGAEVRRSAREGGVSISAWIAEAVEKKLRHEAFVAFMENDWDGPEGAITVEERARAVAEFDALGWTPGTPIGTRRRPNGAGSANGPTQPDGRSTADRLSLSLDPVLCSEVRRSASEAGLSISAWVADTAQTKLRVEAGIALTKEWEEEYGPSTDEEIARARASLGLPPCTPSP